MNPALTNPLHNEHALDPAGDLANDVAELAHARPASFWIAHNDRRTHSEYCSDALALIANHRVPSMVECIALVRRIEELEATVRHQSELLAESSIGTLAPAVARFAAEMGLVVAGKQR